MLKKSLVPGADIQKLTMQSWGDLLLDFDELLGCLAHMGATSVRLSGDV